MMSFSKPFLPFCKSDRNRERHVDIAVVADWQVCDGAGGCLDGADFEVNDARRKRAAAGTGLGI